MSQHSRVGTQFGPYRLDELLGRGGMGEVYRAYDTVKDRVVALKLLNPGLAGDPGYRERFRRESQTAARLGEPHVIPIHDWGEVDGVLFIDMRLVQGGDLRGLLDREHRLAPARTVAVVEQIAAALDAAHAGGLTHRDVKPENILVGDKDFAYLVDFGIANADGDTRLTQAGSAIGSIAYMAPELFDGHPAGPASDVYALTCVLYECLTGGVPYPAPTVSAAIKAAVTATPRPAGALVPGLPRGLDAVIARGLAADPRQRYRSAGELAAAAATALRSGAPPASTASTARQNEPPTAVHPPVPAIAPTRVQSFGGQVPGPPPAGYPAEYAVVPQPAAGRSSLLPILLGAVATLLVIGVGVLVALAVLTDDGDGSAAAASAPQEPPVVPASTIASAERQPSAGPAPSSTPSSVVPAPAPTSTVRTYPAPAPSIEVSADPSAPGYVPPPPPIDEAQYFAQFGAFDRMDTARAKAGEHYGSVIVDGSLVGLSTRYAVVRPTHSLAEAERVCANFGAAQCYPKQRTG
ncbi:putative serine/threonine protein kinase [Gordonia hirsuta DSM 44140 = NBRC 16056]|uniref:non-specific serine/threonine protein kinase n=1 Tax=Gordonia hirsuta DSM 44140 = NBRC 16056 TaxID=1121927 RepID=L7L7E9_9ACTN|nr:serine/threonine-protein kinase [Gordonia hirsuta]GAC55948.1 putative serine/threonine protein kinase [Gordonia hirsuta DSM 44140 = NBRC 16056]